MKIISYGQFVELCHSIIYDYCGPSTGTIYEGGYHISVDFEVDGIYLSIWLFYDKDTGHYKARPELNTNIEFEGETKKSLHIVKNIGYAIEELLKECSQYRIDFAKVYNKEQVYKCEWKPIVKEQK